MSNAVVAAVPKSAVSQRRTAKQRRHLVACSLFPAIVKLQPLAPVEIGCSQGPAMPERSFEDGYLVGWRWMRGNDDVPTIPACSVPLGEAAYREGVIRGVRDACHSPQELATRSEEIKSILDRAQNQKREGSQDGD